MQTTDGAPRDTSSADSVLTGALAEMASSGELQPDQTFDSSAGSTGASPSADGSSAASAAAPSTVPGDEGSGPTDRASRTAAPAPATPTAPSAEKDTAADPLAGTEPFTYTVNGETKTLPGVYRVPGEGLLVPEDQVASVQGLAERVESQDRLIRDVAAKNADFERLTSWDIQDKDGKPQTLTGRDALEAMRVDYARQSAALTVMDSILSDPVKFAQLIGVTADNKIVIDPQALEYLQKDVMLAAGNAEKAARSQFQTLATPPVQPAPVDHSRSAPAIIDQVAKLAGFDAKLLTEQDRMFLGKQIGRYVRTVTPADRVSNPALQVGSPIVDASFQDVIRDRADLRKTANAQATAAEKAGKHNAGMDKGRQPIKATAKISPPAQIPAKTGEGRKKADWDTPLDSALSEMGIAR